MPAVLKKLLFWIIAIAAVLQAVALILGQSYMPGQPF